MRTPAMILAVLSLPAPVLAQEQASLLEAARVAAARVAAIQSNVQPPQPTTTRRSVGRTLTGVVLLAGGALASQRGNSLFNAATARNATRDEWNHTSAEHEQLLNANEQRGCFWRHVPAGDVCVDLLSGLTTSEATLYTLSLDHDFLPAYPLRIHPYLLEDTAAYDRLDEWAHTTVDMENKRRPVATLSAGLAAAGIGVLLATIWSDVPVVRNLHVRRTPTHTAMTTSVEW